MFVVAFGERIQVPEEVRVYIGWPICEERGPYTEIPLKTLNP